MLSRLISRIFPKRNEITLPDKLNGALITHNFQEIMAPLREWVIDNPKSSQNGALSDYASRNGWSGKELDKLKAYIDLYLGNVTEAFERARPRFSGPEFDAELFILGIALLYQNNQFEDAHRLLAELNDQCRARATDRLEYWILSQLICWAVADVEGTKRSIAELLKRENGDIPLVNILGVLIELGDEDLATQIQTRIESSNPQPSYSYSLCLLALGDYERGFRWMESRYEMEEASRYLNKALLNMPRWKGEPLTGKHLLISAEQGLGDTLQMIRYVRHPILGEASSIVFECQPEAISLLEFNYPEIAIVARNYGQVPTNEFDIWIGLMSLVYLCGEATDTAPNHPSYLRPPLESRDYWPMRISQLRRSNKPQIGITWSGQPTHRGDRRRSIPFSTMMEAIRGFDADFYALQTQVPQIHPANLIDVSSELVTLADTAALISELDLVITVDTSVVHLAGALGKPTWLLLPYRYEWRWGLSGEDNRWYDSVKVLRQPATSDWASLLNEVFNKRLKRFIAEGK